MGLAAASLEGFPYRGSWKGFRDEGFGRRKGRTMLFGVKNAGATYQRMMQKCLATQIGKNIQVYIDNIVITTKKVSSMIDDLKETFDNLDMFRLKLNPTKCSFGVPMGELLGYLMDQLNNTKFYQLGNGGNLIFERDLDALSEHLGRPHPEFFGTQTDYQPGGELQWVVVVDLRGKMEPPTSERIHFSKELDNSRVYANQTHLHLSQQTDAIKMLAKDRNSLRQQRAKKDATIARLCGDPGLAVRNTLLCIPLTTPMISLP
ncbi:hypothetical protein QYE76_048330 [Lolium multiflorum]|uniref:Reverse transcriptase domain-containing protein n=1 Tax=Lolium multiflorum TaxID=4521 RepID=A0AAD8PJ17_LOLMU|nr:hypothetical protein QYE76_048330 [Lolium multiflorum]